MAAKSLHKNNFGTGTPKNKQMRLYHETVRTVCKTENGFDEGGR